MLIYNIVCYIKWAQKIDKGDTQIILSSVNESVPLTKPYSYTAWEITSLEITNGLHKSICMNSALVFVLKCIQKAR